MATSVKKVQKMSREAFKLPVFSPDIEKCIRKDAFYTSAQRNKLIHEACRALQGYCREQDCPVSNDDKRLLAHLLYEKAPKSLGDPLKPTHGKEPEVTFKLELIMRFEAKYYKCIFLIAGCISWVVWSDYQVVPEPFPP